MDLLAHALTQRRVDELVALHAAAAGELGRYHQSLEMLAVANHLDALAGEPRLDAALYAFRGDQLCFSYYVLSL